MVAAVNDATGPFRSPYQGRYTADPVGIGSAVPYGRENGLMATDGRVLGVSRVEGPWCGTGESVRSRDGRRATDGRYRRVTPSISSTMPAARASASNADPTTRAPMGGAVRPPVPDVDGSPCPPTSRCVATCWVRDEGVTRSRKATRHSGRYGVRSQVAGSVMKMPLPWWRRITPRASSRT
jgi:hypothetical protein